MQFASVRSQPESNRKKQIQTIFKHKKMFQNRKNSNKTFSEQKQRKSQNPYPWLSVTRLSVTPMLFSKKYYKTMFFFNDLASKHAKSLSVTIRDASWIRNPYPWRLWFFHEFSCAFCFFMTFMVFFMIVIVRFVFFCSTQIQTWQNIFKQIQTCQNICHQVEGTETTLFGDHTLILLCLPCLWAWTGGPA